MGKRVSKKLKQKVIDIKTGKTMTIIEIRTRNDLITRKSKGKWYKVYNNRDEVIHEKIARIDLKKTTYFFVIKYSKDKPLGNSYQSLSMLKSYNRENLKGWYSEEI